MDGIREKRELNLFRKGDRCGVKAHQHINLTYDRCERVPCGRDEENYVDIRAAV